MNRHIFWATILLVGCASSGTAWLSPELRTISIENQAANYGFIKKEHLTDKFTLISFSRITNNAAPINIYIEGDGAAWRSRTMVSSNPTPHNPVAFELAVQDNAANVVYLGRPCQYALHDTACHSKYWTNARFAPEVITSTNQAIDSFAPTAGINMYGFSGGAAVAALVTANRTDVKTLTTIAGNLDHVAVNKYHRVKPMHQSLNPTDIAPQLAHIPQIHFIGTNDKVIPPQIAQSFLSAMGQTNCAQTQLVSATHTKGWQAVWPNLLKQQPSCR